MLCQALALKLNPADLAGASRQPCRNILPGQKAGVIHTPGPFTELLSVRTPFIPTAIIMASRSFSRALRSPLTRQLAAPAAQRRTLISASRTARTGLATALKPSVAGSLQHSRGLKQIDFAGTKETVYGIS